ncbi:arrestin domain-containing protein 3 [Drosophila ananassae]|nr:arrestin domain-containing protein 3 [Drosophila ananassae]
MPSGCTFEFDRRDPIYYSGETINGRAILNTTSTKSVNEVYILFEGEAKVRWDERKSKTYHGRTRYYTEYYRGRHTYQSSKTTVFGSGDMAPGTYTYNFSIPLPLECPSSMVTKYQWKFNNIFKQPLTVLQTYNLNMNPELLIPVVREDIKYFCCWPCRSGPVLSTLTIPFGGYAPGQKIHFTLEIDNQSSRSDLDGIEVCLKQNYKVTADSPYHKSRDKEHRLNESNQVERVLRNSKKVINGTLDIPAVPPSSRNDGIITVNYMVGLTINMGDCAWDSDFDVPIVIGTIPLVQSAADPSHAAEWIPQVPATPHGASADLPPSYDNCKPPTFAEAASFEEKFVDIDVDENNRTDDFIPRYPMYTNFAMPSAPPPPGESVDSPLLATPAFSMPYPPVNQPAYPPANQSAYPPANQPGYPQSYQPGYPPDNQPGYPPVNQPPYPPSYRPPAGYPNPNNQTTFSFGWNANQ